MQLNKMHCRRVGLSGLSGDGGSERNRRRVDGSEWLDFDLGLHRLAAAADGGGSGNYFEPPNEGWGA